MADEIELGQRVLLSMVIEGFAAHLDDGSAMLHSIWRSDRIGAIRDKRRHDRPMNSLR